jgi:ABC-type enterobactin transport system permease subunit
MSNDLSTQVQHISEGGAYGGAGASVILFGLDANEMAVIASAIFAGLSFAVHFYFSWRRDCREQREHELTLEDHYADAPDDKGDDA